MRLGRRVWVVAALTVGLALAAAVTACAQELAATERTLGVSPDPIARSPRLFGMGFLTVVGDDPHNRITLWDFAGNPAGIGSSDSSSTLEYRPGTSSVSGISDQIYSPTPFEHQTLGAMTTGFEGWRRAGGITYGVTGDFGSVRMDEPVGNDVERRTHVSFPHVTGALNGPVPYAKSGHLRYALTMFAGRESGEDQFLTFVRNEAGEYIDRDGATLTPVNLFEPDSRRTTSLGGSATLSYVLGHWLEAAATGHLVNVERALLNTGDRYYFETREKLRGHRPYPAGQLSLVGHAGRHLEWGWDGRLWDARSEQHWVFTISAGIGQNPFAGRGTLSRNEERGSEMRSRLRWTQGPFELGGSLTTGFLQNAITPPDPGDPTSLNQFLYALYRRPNADTLSIPDSISIRHAEQRQWQAAGGVAVRLPGRRGLIGVEYHKTQAELVQAPGGLGPRPISWDVRAGIEYRIAAPLTARAGYIHGAQDADELTRNNETISNTGTLGFSVQPQGAIWSFDVGYGVGWWRADYGDPALPHGGRQQLASQLRWAF